MGPVERALGVIGSLAGLAIGAAMTLVAVLSWASEKEGLGLFAFAVVWSAGCVFVLLRSVAETPKLRVDVIARERAMQRAWADVFRPKAPATNTLEGRTEPTDPNERTLAAFARARGWTHHRPLALVGDVRGVRVAFEHLPDSVTSTLDVDAARVSADQLRALTEHVALRAPGGTLVILGSVARIEWTARELHAEQIDRALDAVAEALAERDAGPYR